MSANDYAFGTNNPNIDGWIQKPFPALNLVGTEINGIQAQTVEVNGTLWIVTNAIYNQPFNGFVQQNPNVGSTALIISPNGTLTRAIAPPNSPKPITWTLASIPTTGNPLVFNVKDYGATGNGTTDDTVAVQTAINTAVAAGGGIVFFPAGNYLRSVTWTWTADGISLIGAGSGAATILSASGSVASSVISTSAANFARVMDLAFTGNGQPPSAPPPNAPDVIAFNGGLQPLVTRCYFTNNTGRTVAFLATSGGELHSCRFFNTGYHGAGLANNLQTPAVYVDPDAVGVKVHDNDFDTVQYFAVQSLGSNCPVYANQLHNVYAAGIRIGMVSSTNEGNGSMVWGNSLDTIHAVAGSGGSGIYSEGVIDTAIWGNFVTSCDSDGIVDANVSYASRFGNIVKNCCQTTGDCGFQFNPHVSGTNTGYTFIGNVSYDDQGSPTQLNGIRILGPGSGGATYTSIVGNSFPGFTGTIGSNPQRGINATDNILDDDTNIVAWNTDWLDRQHLNVASNSVSASTTATGVGTPSNSVLADYNIEKGVMGKNRALHIKAYGILTVAAGVTLYLSFGSVLGNLITYADSTTSSGVAWAIELWMNSADNNNGQHFSYEILVDGALVAAGGGNLSVDTTMDNPLALQATTGAGDSVTCNGCTVTRE